MTSDALNTENVPAANEWSNMKSIGRVICKKTFKDQFSFEAYYFITSLEIDAKLFTCAARGRRGVEANLHCSLDAIFREILLKEFL